MLVFHETSISAADEPVQPVCGCGCWCGCSCGPWQRLAVQSGLSAAIYSVGHAVGSSIGGGVVETM